MNANAINALAQLGFGCTVSRVMEGANHPRPLERLGRITALCAALVAAFLALGAVRAEAKVFCVAASNPDSVDPSCSIGEGQTTVNAALVAAASNSGEDTVLIGPGNFSESSLGYLASDPVNIVGSGSIGSGSGGTTVTMPPDPGSGFVMSISGAIHHISHLELRVSKDSNSTTDTALSVSDAVYLDDVLISAPSDIDYAQGVFVNGGGAAILDQTRIDFPLDKTTTGVQNSNGSTVTLRSSEIKSRDGLVLNGTSANTTVQRSKVTFRGVGIALSQGSLNLSNSLIDMTTSTNYALIAGFAAAPEVNTPSATLNGVTIVGGNPGSSAVRLRADNGDTATVTLDDSIVDMTSANTTAFYVQESGSGNASMTGDYVNFRATYDGGNGIFVESDGAPGSATLSISHGTSVDPGFLGSGPDAYSLSPTSPLLDAGNPAASPGLDINSAPRPLDSTGGCSSRRDQGAYEYLPPPPTATIDSGPAAGSTTADSTPTFAMSSSRICSPAFDCSIDGGATTSCSSPYTPAVLSEGTHTIAVRALGEISNPGTAATRTFTVDTLAPTTTVSGGSRFKAKGRTARVSFVFGSDDPAATFACKVTTTGYKPCSKNFSARLKPGRYKLYAVASDAVGNQDATPAVKSFRVVR